MSVIGIEQITYGVEDVAMCRRFFLDWGLSLVRETSDRLEFETMNGCQVSVVNLNDPALPMAIEPGSTLREVVWSVASVDDLAKLEERLSDQPGYFLSGDDLGCRDPIGFALRFRVSRKRKVETRGTLMNSWGNDVRIDMPSKMYDRALPIEVSHFVLFTNDSAAQEAFYRDKLGFEVSDRYPGHGVFMRCRPHGGHHNIFFVKGPKAMNGLNHVAFKVHDINEVLGGGMHVDRCGWTSLLGPGRHPISSAFFWYVKSPAGALVEYYADEDVLTSAWVPRDFTPGPTVFAEWAIESGIDGNTRRQKNAKVPDGKFLTDKKDS